MAYGAVRILFRCRMCHCHLKCECEEKEGEGERAATERVHASRPSCKKKKKKKVINRHRPLHVRKY